MKRFISLLFIGILSFSTLVTRGQEAQDTTVHYRITTSDGNEYFGRIISRDSLSIVFSTSNLGMIRLPLPDINTIDVIQPDQFVGGKVWYPNLQATRYYFAPNGYGLKKGEIYYQNVWVLFNQFSFGVVDYFSIGFGIVPLFLFAGSPTPVWLIPKISIPVVRDKFNIGAGALVGTVLGEENTGFGLLYGLVTAGSRDKNVSLGIGYGYVNGELAKRPLINLSSFIRVSPRSYLITENYIIPGDDNTVLISLGGRSIIKRVGLDYGLFAPFSGAMDELFAIPWLGITVPLHKAKLDKKMSSTLAR